MKIVLKNININYIQYGDGKDVILLHGWGQNIEMMKFIGDKICDKNRVTIIDFPGFGESEEPPKDWFVEDFVDLLHELIESLEIKKPILVGHSFGGRVAIKYASQYDVDKLVLMGAPCFYDKQELDMKTKVLKGLKRLPGMNAFGEYMKKYIGSNDYRNASPRMRQTLVNVIREDLSEDAKKIIAPTLLIWGTDDVDAPIAEARRLEGILHDGALIELPGTHYAYIENLDRVVSILDSFF